MDVSFALADSYTRANRNDLAFSALPDAPVLPYVARKRRLRGVVVNVRELAARVRLPVRRQPTARATEACST